MHVSDSYCMFDMSVECPGGDRITVQKSLPSDIPSVVILREETPNPRSQSSPL